MIRIKEIDKISPDDGERSRVGSLGSGVLRFIHAYLSDDTSAIPANRQAVTDWYHDREKLYENNIFNENNQCSRTETVRPRPRVL